MRWRTAPEGGRVYYFDDEEPDVFHIKESFHRLATAPACICHGGNINPKCETHRLDYDDAD